VSCCGDQHSHRKQSLHTIHACIDWTMTKTSAFELALEEPCSIRDGLGCFASGKDRGRPGPIPGLLASACKEKKQRGLRLGPKRLRSGKSAFHYALALVPSHSNLFVLVPNRPCRASILVRCFGPSRTFLVLKLEAELIHR
jgi:hypothetical protein